MPTRYRTRAAAAPSRGPRAHSVLRPIAGQCFEIQISQDGNHWDITIPEISARAEARSRAAVELAARDCIANSTGIPIGYISVWVRD